jgi:hypothetical protein
MLAGVGAAHVVVAAALIDLTPGIFGALAELLEDRTRPPMEVGVDDVHVGHPASGEDSMILGPAPFPVNASAALAHGQGGRFLQ